MILLGFLKLLLLISIFFVDIILLISYTHFISIKIIISYFTLRSEEVSPFGNYLFFGEKKLRNKQNKMKNKPIMNRNDFARWKFTASACGLAYWPFVAQLIQLPPSRAI